MYRQTSTQGVPWGETAGPRSGSRLGSRAPATLAAPVIHLRSVTLPVEPEHRPHGYPFAVPAVSALERLAFGSEVTVFVGENGSGKSTLLEALAIASERHAIGGAPLDRDPTLDAVRPLADALRLVWSKRTSRGFFLRAEDFFNFSRRNREIATEMQGFADRFDDPRDPRVKGYMLGQKRAIEERYGGDLNDLSHGESFLQLLQARVVPGGLYLIDEPEAALSPRGQLAFLSFLKARTEERCQFVIATHSPFVLSVPGATLLCFDEAGLREAPYEELDHVRLARDFLAAPERYWRHL